MPRSHWSRHSRISPLPSASSPRYSGPKSLAASRKQCFNTATSSTAYRAIHIARLDGHVVGTAAAVIGDAGLNLFGGSVLQEARGRGVYRALIQARWDFAVE